MQDLTNEILEVVNKLNIDYMPTRKDLEGNGYTALSSKIQRNGGFAYWREKLNLKQKVKRKRWNEEEIKKELLKVVKEHFNNEYMPTRSQLCQITGNQKLHNAIIRSFGYRGWAEKLNLKLQDNETKFGQDYELIAIEKLKEQGYKIEK